MTRLEQQAVSDTEFTDTCEHFDIDPEEAPDGCDEAGELILRMGIYLHKIDGRWYHIPESARDAAEREVL